MTARPTKVVVDGELLDLEVARVSPVDHGLLVGDGVFETLRIYGGVPFAWTRHLDRLRVSAAGLGLTVPTDGELREQSERVIAANHLEEGRLRITVTGGPAPLGSERGDEPPTVVVAASSARPWPETTDVVVVPWARNELGATAGLKTISYAENVRALAHAHEHGAGEAVFPNTRGHLCEATGSNVFVVRDDIVATPPAEAGCLLGVTRALVLELCVALDIAAEERIVAVQELRDADEAFLTSSTREVQGIARVDGHPLATAPGPITARLDAAFRDLVTRDLDP